MLTEVKKRIIRKKSVDALWLPKNPKKNDVITIFCDKPGKLHWGVDGWNRPPFDNRPIGSTVWHDGVAVESPLTGPDGNGKYFVQIGPFNKTAVRQVNFVFHHADDSWSSPNQTIPIGRRSIFAIHQPT
jgi:hypothetical protein